MGDKLGVVVHTYNPSTWKAEAEGSPVEVQPGLHIMKPSSTKKKKKKPGCRWLTPVLLATQEAEIRRITVQSQPEHLKKSYHKKLGW
jgi:hypothetical protein